MEIRTKVYVGMNVHTDSGMIAALPEPFSKRRNVRILQDGVLRACADGIEATRARTAAGRMRYLAWSEAQRRAFEHHVVCLSRFPVRVPCKHLANQVLGRVLKRLPKDMVRRYGYRPWVVETYVGADQEGTCFKAAKFVNMGQTAGSRPGPD